MVALEAAVTEADRGIAWFGFVYGVLPISMAISLPYVPARQDFRAQALRVAAVATVLMVLVDVLAPAGRVDLDPTTGIVAEGTREFVEVSEHSLVSGIRTVGSAVASGFEGVDERRSLYPFSHPRSQLAWALLKLSGLVIPLGLALSISWAVQWIRREIPDRRSAVGAQFFTCWALGPLSYLIVFIGTDRATTDVLVGGGSLLLIPLPSILFVLAAWVLSTRTSGAAVDMRETVAQ